MSEWSPDQYLLFERERTQPSVDLVMHIPLDEPKKIVDIGCGPGNSTAVLKARYPDAEILGVDSSEEMIARANANFPDSGINFSVCDAGGGLSELGNDFDLVFSNACIQWIPDHEKLIPSMLSLLKEGGALAVQTPVNADEAAYRIISDTLESARWKTHFDAVRDSNDNNLTVPAYYDLLSAHAAGVSLWQTRYFHIMPSHRSILDWAESTRLRPYLDALDDSKKSELRAELLEAIKDAYSPQKDGSILFGFLRLFFIAVK